MSYAPVHSGALRLVTRKGAALTLTRTTQTVSETTGIAGAPSTSTIAGSAVQAAEDPKRYERLSLVMSGMRTLFFTPSTFGDSVLPGDTGSWAGTGVTVQGVENVAPDGTVIGSYLIVGP